MEMLRIVDKVLVMSVNPTNNAGQMYLPNVCNKLAKLLAIKEEMIISNLIFN